MALTNNIIQFLQIVESNLPAAKTPGVLYFCTDTGNVYLDDSTNNRVSISKSLIFLATEADRLALLTFDSGKLYLVIGSGKLYIYSGGWISLGGSTTIEFANYDLAVGANTITDSRITTSSSGKFIPDLSLIDLAPTINVVCGNGSATISNSSSYVITGRVLITV